MKPIQWRKEKKVESLIFFEFETRKMFSEAIGEIVIQGSKTDTIVIKSNF